jgi:hypothetical protein
MAPDAGGDPGGNWSFTTWDGGGDSGFHDVNCQTTTTTSTTCAVKVTLQSAEESMDSTPGGAAYCTEQAYCDPNSQSWSIGDTRKYTATLTVDPSG